MLWGRPSTEVLLNQEHNSSAPYVEYEWGKSKLSGNLKLFIHFLNLEESDTSASNGIGRAIRTHPRCHYHSLAGVGSPLQSSAVSNRSLQQASGGIEACTRHAATIFRHHPVALHLRRKLGRQIKRLGRFIHLSCFAQAHGTDGEEHGQFRLGRQRL